MGSLGIIHRSGRNLIVPWCAAFFGDARKNRAAKSIGVYRLTGEAGRVIRHHLGGVDAWSPSQFTASESG